MKRSDFATIILIGGFAIITGVLIGNWLYGDLSKERATITFLDPISSNFLAPDPEIFNVDAVNPTVPVIIGQDGHPIPEEEEDEEDDDGTEDEEWIDNGGL